MRKGGEPQTWTETNLDLLLELVLSHKSAHIRPFLQAHEIASYGNKETTKQRLQEALKNHSFAPEDLVRLLNSIEEYGNQHVYLYRNDARDVLDEIRDIERFRRALNRAELIPLLNATRPLFLPRDPSLVSIHHDGSRLQAKWVQQDRRIHFVREWEEGDSVFREYVKRVSRRVSLFRLEFATGQAELLLARLPSGEIYEEAKEKCVSDLALFLNWQTFTPLALGKAIIKIERSGEIDRRGCNFRTAAGGFVLLRSPDERHDYDKDPEIRNARGALSLKSAPFYGNFYWLDRGGLKRRVHTHLYARDGGVGFFGEYIESEVDYVLQRIRHHC